MKRLAILGSHLPRQCGIRARGRRRLRRVACGYTLGVDGDAINLYCGAADTCVAMATGSVAQLLQWLGRHGTAA